jgi:hypothetical protein
MHKPKTQKCIACTTAEQLNMDKTAVYKILICTCEGNQQGN